MKEATGQFTKVTYGFATSYACNRVTLKMCRPILIKPFLGAWNFPLLSAGMRFEETDIWLSHQRSVFSVRVTLLHEKAQNLASDIQKFA